MTRLMLSKDQKQREDKNEFQLKKFKVELQSTFQEGLKV